MVAQFGTAEGSSADPARTTIGRLVLTVSIATVVLWLLLVAWLAVRDFRGQLQPMAFYALLLAGMISIGLTSLLRFAWHGLGMQPSRIRSRFAILWAVPSVALFLLGLALSIEGTGAPALILFWGMLIGCELTWWWWAWRHTPTGNRSAGRPEDGRTEITASATATGPHAVEQESGEDDDLVPDDVSQQMTRSSADEEGDTVTGLLRARFAPHERSQNLHVAICPPMRHRPKVTVTQLSGPRSRIKTGDVQPHGIRFDLRLSSASELEQDVLLHFEACCGKPEPTGVGGSHLR